MAFFVKRPSIGDTAGMYTTGMEKTILLVGLGNIGKEYNDTRHNIGFEVIDFFAKSQEFPNFVVNKNRKCAESSVLLGSIRVILCKPTTLMNNSGEAVLAMQHFYKIPNDATLAVHDEVDVNFGQIRTRTGGSSAGHNGIKSIIENCGDSFHRLRIGIGPKKPQQMELSDFVLGKFAKSQEKTKELILKESNALLNEFIYGGQLFEETRTVES